MKKVYFDKGHGGSDPGAVGNGMREKDLVAKIMDYAEAFIKANYEGVQTRMSRAGDQTVSLQQRTDDANQWGADVFISSHINAFNGNARGFETFRHDNAPSATRTLQNVLHKEIVATISKFGSVPDRGQKTANFHVLRETRMSAVLTETLFIDNANDAKLLKQEAFLKAVGEAHAVGVAKFLGLTEKPKKADDNAVMYRVVTGSFASRENAEARIAALKKAGFDSFIDIYKG